MDGGGWAWRRETSRQHLPIKTNRAQGKKWIQGREAERSMLVYIDERYGTTSSPRRKITANGSKEIA